MATMTETPEATNTETPPSHEFHAEAHVLSGELQRPVEQKIERHVPVALKGRRSGHLHRFSEDISIEGLITFKSGHARVSGSKSLKHHGWVTLSTSILEGLNVFEVITADRLVSQVSTEHPLKDGHFPHVTFLGTQFNNLKVSGFPVTLKLNFGICGKKSNGETSFLDDFEFLSGVKDQTEKIVEQMAKADDLPKDLKHEYDKRLARIKDLMAGKKSGHEPNLTCSLVESIDAIPSLGARAFGHVLVIPDFGTVSLGEVEVGEKKYDSSYKRPDNYFELKIINMNLGCVGTGSVSAGTVTANGGHKP
jgi:hypothetical protein